MIDTSFFLDFFLSKKEQKVRFQTDFYVNPNIIERQFSQNVTVLYARYSVFFNWFLDKKRTKLEISGRFSGKDRYNRTRIFPKRRALI